MRFVFVLLLVTVSGVLVGQDRFRALADVLEAAQVDHPGLDGAVEMSVSGTPIGEFVRALGLAHKLNITVDPAVKGEVLNTFSDARVSDVLIYLCKQFDLDLEFIGSIIALHPHRAEVVPEEPVPEWRPPNVTFNSDSGWIDLDLRRDSLVSVARAINMASGSNIVIAPGLEDRPVSIFLRNSALPGALEKLAFANGLAVERTKDGAFLLRAVPEAQAKNVSDKSGKGATLSHSPAHLEITARPDGRLTLSAQEASIGQIIEQASLALKKNYFLYDVVEQPTNLLVEQVTYDELLGYLLRGTEFSYQVKDGIYMIGKRDLEGLRQTELVRLLNRPTKDLIEAIPEGIKKDVTLKEFVELNGIILSGDALRIEEIKQFLRTIDQIVPMVMIEVMIVDVNRTRSISTGIRMGLGGGPENSGGTILPGVNYDMNAGTINSLINSFNGFGLFNLGNVTKDFYIGIQALETDGVLKMRSTPQLSTLNGHEATLSIGETEYYLEIRNDLIGTQNPTVTTSQIYKPINADLSLTILPMVSSEDMVTLEIEVNQSNFTERIAETAPPGSVERKFSSIIRVRDRDMIVLGGLEEKENSKNGSGLPLIARIPIIKWFFGNRSSKRSRSKLTIFIRPIIIY